MLSLSPLRSDDLIVSMKSVEGYRSPLSYSLDQAKVSLILLYYICHCSQMFFFPAALEEAGLEIAFKVGWSQRFRLMDMWMDGKNR